MAASVSILPSAFGSKTAESVQKYRQAKSSQFPKEICFSFSSLMPKKYRQKLSLPLTVSPKIQLSKFSHTVINTVRREAFPSIDPERCRIIYRYLSDVCVVF
ncbi:hypothetical protein [Sphingomonas sp. YL-JM2C]|jgi:hypothetical protein